MDVVACYCSWDIPGVDALPAHHHPWSHLDTEEAGTLIEKGPLAGTRHPRRVPDPWMEPHLWVDWRAIARALRHH